MATTDRPWWRRERTSLLVALLCLVVYNANLRSIGAGDTLPARYLPLSIWRHGTLALDPIASWVAHGHPRYEPASNLRQAGVAFEPPAYWMIRGRGGRLVSLYPIVAPVLVAPLYLPAAVYLWLQDWQPWLVDWAAAAMEKLSASIVATLTVLLVFLLLRREAARWSVPLAFAFAFGTNTWMISSQALWQHGVGALLVAVGLLLATAKPTPARLVALGAVGMAMAANRPPDAFVAAALALYAVWTARRAAAWLLAGAALPLVLLIAYNVALAGSLFGGYGTVESPGFFGHPLGIGLAGLLVSPMRGLLVFSPFLLFAALGLAQRLRAPGERALAALLTAAVVAQLLLYALADWRAGTSWGPRWLTDVLPILMWMLAPVPRRLRLAARVALVATMVAAIAIQAIGAFRYTGQSDEVLRASGEDWQRAAFRWANAPFVTELRHARPRGDLWCSARGYLDRLGDASVTTPGAEPPEISNGMRLRGWALACGRTPAQVLLLVEGRVIGWTTQFAPSRPDVEAATRSSAPSTWEVAADTAGLAPGRHTLQVAVRIEPRSDIRIVSETAVRFAAEPVAGAVELAQLATRAASRLRERQNAAGYWLTAHTREPRFVDPQPEMNTYVTAMLADFLTPVARESGLEETLARARRHLTAQIEEDGLVRYHGRADGPTVGTLGCAITPDADDTVLVWRIAPPPSADPRRAPMRRTLEAYRDSRGFYRTWLAPQARYQCIDPGGDPNPADVAIQMHVLQLLAQGEPAAFAALCQALAGAIDDARLWVYYARSPLVPLLRQADLERLGCEVPIPEGRRAGVPGQADWIAIAQRLTGTGGARERAESDVALLARLGRDDFAELRRAPPLLYHNDLTASVPRFYWSEDFGYALWLRLSAVARTAADRTAPR